MKKRMVATSKFWILGTFLIAAGAFAAGCGDSESTSDRCTHGDTREFTCGSDKNGAQPQTCVDGQWYSTNFCSLPDGTRHPDDTFGTAENCVDGATRAAVCGEGNRGLRPEVCADKEWTPTNACSFGPNGDGGDRDAGDKDTDDEDANPNGDPGACTTFEVIPSLIETALTLDGCYKANSDVTVRGEGHLTIKPGSVLLFAENTGLLLEVGKLSAEGLEDSGILFAGQSPEPGFWRGIKFGNSASASNKLIYVTIDGGGSSDVFAGTEPANLMLDSAAGLTVKVTLENSTLQNSGGWGIFADGASRFTNFSENTITANKLGAAILHSNVVGDLDAASIYSGNTADEVRITGEEFVGDATWKSLDVPYHIANDLTVSGDGTALTIEAGAAFEFGENKGLEIYDNATLTAVGDAANPIIFRGRENTPGFWRGIKFANTNSAANKLVHVTIDGGGSSEVYPGTEAANLMLDSSGGRTTKITLKDSTLQNSGGAALFVDGAESTLAECSGVNFTLADIIGSGAAAAATVCGL